MVRVAFMRTLSWPQPSLVHRQHFWSLTGSLVLLDFACLHQFIASPDFLIACSSSVWSCCCIRMMPSLCPFYVLNCIILCATSRITSQILKPKRWQVWPRANRVYCGALDAKEAPKLSVSLIYVRTSKTWTEIIQEVKKRIKLTWKHI